MTDLFDDPDYDAKLRKFKEALGLLVKGQTGITRKEDGETETLLITDDGWATYVHANIGEELAGKCLTGKETPHVAAANLLRAIQFKPDTTTYSHMWN